jgi:hypothetical protein
MAHAFLLVLKRVIDEVTELTTLRSLIGKLPKYLLHDFLACQCSSWNELLGFIAKIEGNHAALENGYGITTVIYLLSVVDDSKYLIVWANGNNFRLE